MILERQERKFLEAIRRGLEQDIHRIDQLLKQAAAPRLLREGDTSERIKKILHGIRERGGKVTKQELGDIVSGAGMIVTAVGSLYQAGYLKQDLKGKGYVVLGPRARRPRTADQNQ